MNGHHLILGRLTDIITGETLDDTLDERYRQEIGRLLIEQKGFARRDVTPRHQMTFQVDGKRARLPVTYVVRLHDRIAMIVQFGPGSLVTRHRPALAISRLVTDYQVPVVVVTNGEQADILDGGTGRVEAAGFDNIPARKALAKRLDGHTWAAVPVQRATMEARILMAFEVDDRCPCDDSVCTLGGN
jgi:hypothetical protein